jgi:hypothetical protein
MPRLRTRTNWRKAVAFGDTLGELVVALRDLKIAQPRITHPGDPIDLFNVRRRHIRHLPISALSSAESNAIISAWQDSKDVPWGRFDFR